MYIYNVYLFVYIWYMVYVVNENWILVSMTKCQCLCQPTTMFSLYNVSNNEYNLFIPSYFTNLKFELHFFQFFSVYIATYYYLPRYLLLIKQFKKGKYVIKWVSTHVAIPKQHICKFSTWQDSICFITYMLWNIHSRMMYKNMSDSLNIWEWKNINLAFTIIFYVLNESNNNFWNRSNFLEDYSYWWKLNNYYILLGLDSSFGFKWR
jgi:hypothetical protein